MEENNTQKDSSYGKSFLKELLSFVKLFVIAYIAAFLFTHLIIINIYVPTGSMTNTIMEHDRLIGSRLSYIFSSPERGDIIVFKYPDDETQKFVKRVIGIPGDVIEITDGTVSVNGEILDEPYIREPMNKYETLYYVVPEDSYFVMGDNRNDSKDSRYWSTSNYVKKEQILAKAIFKYFNTEDKKIDFKMVK